MEAWDKISKILDYTGDDDFQQGDRPFLSLITKTRLRREKNNIIQALRESSQKPKDQYVFGAFEPEGILILGFLMMSKGLPLTSNLQQYLRAAIVMQKEKVNLLKGRYFQQRKMQLNHLENKLEDYEPSSEGTRINLYGTKANVRRAKKRDKKFREGKKREKLKDREMSREDIRQFAYTYMLLRMFHGARETNRIFKIYAPDINTKVLCDFILNEGMADEKCRPNMRFRDHIYTLLTRYRT